MAKKLTQKQLLILAQKSPKAAELLMRKEELEMQKALLEKENSDERFENFRSEFSERIKEKEQPISVKEYIKGDKPSSEELLELILPLIPEPIAGEDGKTPTEDEIKALIEPLIPEPLKGENGKTPTMEEIADIVKPMVEQLMPVMPTLDENNIIEQLMGKIDIDVATKSTELEDMPDTIKAGYVLVGNNSGTGYSMKKMPKGGQYLSGGGKLTILSNGSEINEHVRSINFTGGATVSGDRDILVDISGGTGGDGLITVVTSTAHGLQVGNTITTTFAEAQADSGLTLGVGIVAEVVSTTEFKYQSSGEVVLTAAEWNAVSDDGENLQPGEYYYVSTANAGNITKVRPTTVGQFENPIGYAQSETSFVVASWRSYQIGTGVNPAPYLESQTFKFNHAETNNITILGSFFTPTTTVTISGQTVNSVTFVSDNELTVNVTSGTTNGFYDVTVANANGSTVATGIFEVELSTWLDLRSGGNTFTDGNGAGNDIRYRSGMSLSRDADGMFFQGSAPWSSWVKFESQAFTRASMSTVEWIVQDISNFFMIGIGSNATNETSTAQYAQAETEAYFNSATQLWGLYGNNGTIGNAGSQAVTTAITSGEAYKIRFTQSGGAGGQFTLYQLPSAAPTDWDDLSTVVTTFTIGGTLNPDEANLFPFIIPPNTGTTRFLALKVT